MNFDDIKDKLREQLMVLWSQIQETSAWNKLSEEFGNLSQRKQKGVLIALVVISSLLLLMLPYSFYSSTADTVTEYETKRDLIRELFRVKRDSAILDNATPAISGSDLMSRAQSQVNSSQLVPEQIKSVTEFDNAGPQASSVIPKGVIQKGVAVSLAKLTLKQVVDIGYRLQTVHQGAKMVALEVSASSVNPNYFDVTYKLVSFMMPAEPTPKPKTGKGSAKKFGAKAKKESSED